MTRIIEEEEMPMLKYYDFSTYSRFANFAFFNPCVMFGRGRRLRGIILRLIVMLQIPLEVKQSRF